MIAEKLAAILDFGPCQIGQIVILPTSAGAAFALCHLDDQDQLEHLEIHRQVADARNISLRAADGHYRFTKGEMSLKRGWLLLLPDLDSLQRALDLFYPAALGLWIADQHGKLDIQHLRDKLIRQTGMYQSARKISDSGAQTLVRELCGPGHCCVKKILWRVTASTPLEESEATRFSGILGHPKSAIPLLCREACNHFVAEAQKTAKAEAKGTECKGK